MNDQEKISLQGEKKFASHILGIINYDWHGWAYIVEAIKIACLEKMIENSE